MLVVTLLLFITVPALFLLLRKRYQVPPGPRPLPLVGNIFQLRGGREWLKYTQWGLEYGPIVSLNLLGRRVFVLNSHSMAVDILEKNMNATSDRPQDMVMGAELIGWNRATALNPGGAQHRKYRRLLSKSLNSTAVRGLRPLQQNAAESLLKDLLNTPSDFLDHIRFSVGRMIINLSYGHDMRIGDAEYIIEAERAHEIFAQTAKSFAFAVDLVPALKYIPSWMPGAGFKRQAAQWRSELDQLTKVPFGIVKTEVQNGSAGKSYVADHLRSPKPLSKEDEDDIAWTAASLYTGGADTTTVGLTVFVMMMCRHRDIQVRAQQEIDRVTDGSRLPNISDQSSLPYVSACVNEILRWWTILPVGIPHRTMTDIVYGNYHLPAGSTIVSNLWGMMHSETAYSDPYKFKPERFLPVHQGGLGEPECLPTIFGFGRRICPGRFLAESGLWTFAATILSVFDILPVKDELGNDVLPAPESGPDIIRYPKPYDCIISPRSPACAKLVTCPVATD